MKTRNPKDGEAGNGEEERVGSEIGRDKNCEHGPATFQLRVAVAGMTVLPSLRTVRSVYMAQ